MVLVAAAFDATCWIKKHELHAGHHDPKSAWLVNSGESIFSPHSPLKVQARCFFENQRFVWSESSLLHFSGLTPAISKTHGSQFLNSNAKDISGAEPFEAAWKYVKLNDRKLRNRGIFRVSTCWNVTYGNTSKWGFAHIGKQDSKCKAVCDV